ncbi:MAG: tRNA preQ1(34) S-adenosylmethionine ribosyltransferase-isomerase QueA [Clostridiales bacterium]|nr:tRNA preQ1(34) S-adenosylmethionine ribosyltransferase-isomerase QueA [Clostridiales bacterium]
MKTSDFFYELPEELIAQTPLPQRDASRLLVLDRAADTLRHRRFPDVLEELSPGDLLVLNNSRVIPARLFGRREGAGAAIEVLLLRAREPLLWEVLVRPGRRAGPGAELWFEEGLRCRIEQSLEDGVRLARFCCEGDFLALLDRIGRMPLPPYIRQELRENERYQTVYATETGSAAAPTAGLHFTPALLEQAQARGIGVATLTLHVGLGTFRPVREREVAAHHMHSEWCSVPEQTAQAVNETRRRGGRVVAVGTTSCRTLESMCEGGRLLAGSRDTGIFIYPPYTFQLVDALITNFHLPESTLLMLVSALAGRERILAAYREAVAQRYRFFSFGDAMLIL